MAGGMQQMLKQANQMQSRMKKIQEELKQKTYSAKAGGDAVCVSVSGEYLLSKISIQDELFKDADSETLQDLIIIASNEAIKAAKKDSETQMNQVTGGAMPGLF
ncbi:MAG: YbaB/EbfC family nucleoid-associated protein [Bdellovibrionaceae bacterium]|nr:YbaB/EbfC family nucleoid-associated protein [Pseudobdellovibrionaceae bacterium]